MLNNIYKCQSTFKLYFIIYTTGCLITFKFNLTVFNNLLLKLIQQTEGGGESEAKAAIHVLLLAVVNI